MPMTKWVITCEHGGNIIPKTYQSLFTGANAVLATHRGWDIGALPIAQALAKHVADYQQFMTISRLLIELNRSMHHEQLWSEYTRALDTMAKQTLLDEIYLPYRNSVENYIVNSIKQGHRIVHLSIHSFTPIMGGVVRTAEIGLLYDPARENEKIFCTYWQTQLKQIQATWRIRRNYPYRGDTDGFTTYLREKFATQNYIGVELEMNQELLIKEEEKVKEAIIKSVTNLKKWLPEQDSNL